MTTMITAKMTVDYDDDDTDDCTDEVTMSLCATVDRRRLNRNSILEER